MMSLRKKLEARISKKEQSIQSLERDMSDIAANIRAERAAIQELLDVIKMLPKEEEDEEKTTTQLRAGSTLYKAYEVLNKVGRPLHIDELLRALGKEVNRKNRTSVAGSLSAYVRNGHIFSKTGPNVFFLKDKEVKDDEEQKGENVYSLNR